MPSPSGQPRPSDSGDPSPARLTPPRVLAPPHRALASPPRLSRASRHCRPRGWRALAARCTAAAPSASSRLGSAPRLSSSSTALRSGRSEWTATFAPSLARPGPPPPSPRLRLPQGCPKPLGRAGRRVHAGSVREPRGPARRVPISRRGLVRTRRPTPCLGCPWDGAAQCPQPSGPAPHGRPHRGSRTLVPAGTHDTEWRSSRPGATDKAPGGWRLSVSLSLVKSGEMRTHPEGGCGAASQGPEVPTGYYVSQSVLPKGASVDGHSLDTA